MNIDYIFVVSPIGYTHSQLFLPMAEALCAGLKELGHDTKILTNGLEIDLKKRAIILGAHLLGGIQPPSNWIIYNTEQIGEGFANNPQYIMLMRHYEVWDYSMMNIEALSQMGITAKYCGVGYSPCLSQIEKPETQDIDVLFYGSLNERRKKVLEEISTKCKFHFSFGVYGQELNKLIARSKVIVNLHFYETVIFEIIRCSYLMANKKCIVSEFGKDYSLEEPFLDAICFSSYKDIADNCLSLLQWQDARELKEQIAFETFSKMLQSNYLKAVL